MGPSWVTGLCAFEAPHLVIVELDVICFGPGHGGAAGAQDLADHILQGLPLLLRRPRQRREEAIKVDPPLALPASSRAVR